MNIILAVLSMALSLGLGLPAVGFNPPPVAAYVSSDGVSWSPMSGSFSGGSTMAPSNSVGLYCQNLTTKLWAPCTPSSSGVSSISSTGSLSVSSSSGSYTIDINPGNSNTWTASQNFNAGLNLASGQVLSWNGDTGLSRTAAGQLACGTGSQGSTGCQITSTGFIVTTLIALSASSGEQVASNLGVLWSSTTGFNGTKDSGLDRQKAGVVEVNNGTVGNANGSFAASAYYGPATAPTGTCTTTGAWVFSQDGHATVCLSGTWASKI